MNTISKERLIIELYQAAIDANATEPNALGVILFGSRARPEWHPFKPHLESDVDLIPVCREYRIQSVDVLLNTITSKLQILSLKGHIFPTIEVDKELSLSSCFFIFKLLDEFSLGITTDTAINQKILEYTRTLKGKSSNPEAIKWRSWK